MTFRRLALAALLLLPAAGFASAADRPVVVELFTSQGCSACPPAEALLGEYAGRADVLALGFHVTYWDDLGWKDTFSFEGATERQSAYAGRLGGGSFTPQMVIDGQTSVVGSRRGEAGAAIAKAAAHDVGSAEIALARRDGRVNVRIGAGRGGARVLLVGFDRKRQTAIARGENGGRTVDQSNVVRSIRSLGTWNGAALQLSEAAPAGEDAAVILQEPNGRIAGAARLGS